MAALPTDPDYADEDADDVTSKADGMSIDPGYTYTDRTYAVSECRE